MGRLIDSEALLEEIKRELERGRAIDPFFDGTLFHYTGIKAIIENQPTAYNVDKVVEELEDLIQRCCYCRESCNEKCLIERIIEIVRGGGVNEIKN